MDFSIMRSQEKQKVEYLTYVRERERLLGGYSPDQLQSQSKIPQIDSCISLRYKVRETKFNNVYKYTRQRRNIREIIAILSKLNIYELGTETTCSNVINSL